METVTFDKSRDGGVVTRYQGKVAFPKSKYRPRVGETWEVVEASLNPKGTVYFLDIRPYVPQVQEFGPARLRMKYWEQSGKGKWSFVLSRGEKAIRDFVPEIDQYDSISGVVPDIDVLPIEPGEYDVDVWVAKPSFLWEVTRVVPVSLVLSTASAQAQIIARQREDFAGFTREEMDREVDAAFEAVGLQTSDVWHATSASKAWVKAHACGYNEPLNLFYRRAESVDEMRTIIQIEAAAIRAALDATPVVWGYRLGYYGQGMPCTTSSLHTESWHVEEYQMFARPGTPQGVVQEWYNASGKPEGIVKRGITTA